MTNYYILKIPDDPVYQKQYPDEFSESAKRFQFMVFPWFLQ